MKFDWFIGIDVSKATLDVVFCHKENPEQFTWKQFDNTTAGFKQLLTCGSPPGLKSKKLDLKDSLFCMEHTGHYTLALCCRFGDPIFARPTAGLYAGEPFAFEKILGHCPGKK